MRLLSTEITPLTNDFLCLELSASEFIQSPFRNRAVFHSHPEIEIVFIVEGCGKMVIWDKVEPFGSGDIIIIGSGVPHIWISDETFYKNSSAPDSRVIVTYFNISKFQKLFNSMDEFKGIRELIQQASRGIRILGETRNTVAEKLVTLSSDRGFEKIRGLLQIMHIISTANDKGFIVNEFVQKEDALYSDRLITVVKYIRDNFQNQISLDDVSRIACMSKQYFCRFFRNRTKKTFLQFLYEQRINHACKLLIQSNLQIWEISDLCGFKTITWFYKVFKDRMGSSPYQYKEALKR